MCAFSTLERRDGVQLRGLQSAKIHGTVYYHFSVGFSYIFFFGQFLVNCASQHPSPTPDKFTPWQKFVQSLTLAAGSVTTSGRQRETALMANAIQCDRLFSRLFSHSILRTALFRAFWQFHHSVSSWDNNLAAFEFFLRLSRFVLYYVTASGLALM